jgi:hypothetical protein
MRPTRCLPLETAAPAVLLILTALAGCGGSTGDPTDAAQGVDGTIGGVGSCTLREVVGEAGQSGATLEICQELVGGATASDLASLRQGCVAPTGTADAGLQVQAQFRAAPCPHEHALGGCRITQAGKTVGNWYYETDSDVGSSPDQIRQLCAGIGGTYIPA